MYGSTDKRDLIGRTSFDLIDPEEREKALEGMKQVIEKGYIKGRDYHIITKDGSKILVEMDVSLLKNADCRPFGFVGVSRDITERRRMEQELVRLERLRSLGEMSAGVSHNLNNILTSVLGPAQILQRMTDDPQVRRETENIIRAAKRARDLVHRLHLSTRGVEEDVLQPVRVNKVVRDAVRMARPRWKDEPEVRGIAIDVVTELEDVPPLRGKESRLHDITVNLIINAVHAMPEGGTIMIRTEAVEEGVQITFSDTGIGMDEETRRRVFEPFFTTKMNVGSGLGLSTAYGAVTTWGGNIEVESKPGKGTTFTLLLPIWEGVEIQAEEAVEARREHRARLLVVEDDEGVCDLLSRLLGKDHEVEAVLSSQEALERFAPGKYDVALIDQAMPGMPGDYVAREMRRADPLLATVLITGWEFKEDDPVLSAYDLRIQKPFEDIRQIENVVDLAVALHGRRVEEGD